MQLDDILEEHSIKVISQKTKISEENLEALISENFEYMVKAKALGFISILERDFNIDLSKLKTKALEYYESHDAAHQSIAIGLPVSEEKKGRSKWFLLVMLGLLVYVSWYFFTQFDKKTFTTLLPFSEDKIEAQASIESHKKMNEVMKDDKLSIHNTFTHTQTDATGAQTDIVVANIEPNASKEEVLQKEVVKIVEKSNVIDNGKTKRRE